MLSVANTSKFQKPYKIGIVGAGAVGSALAYASMIRQSARIIALYDINEKKVNAEVEDISHGIMFTGGIIGGGADIKVLRDSQVVIITAGAAQKPGQTRLELVEINTKILSSMMPQLMEVCPDATFVIVTNPCDVLTVVARKITGLPSNRVFSSGTLLDTSRLRHLIAQRAGIAPSNVHAMIVGEHGDSEFPLWSSATISSVPIRDWTVRGTKFFTDDVLDDIGRSVTRAAYRVIEGKGATNYAIGLSGSYLAERLLSPTRSVLPVSGVLDDYYGISGVALSVPSLVSNEGLIEQVKVPMTDDEIGKLRASADTLRATLASVGF